jgi:hypothetical protein
VLQHCTISWINANRTQSQIYRTINIANGICCGHLPFDNGEDSNIKRATVLLRPRLKGDLNAEWPEIRIQQIIHLINACASPNCVQRAPQSRRVKYDEI